MSYSPVIGLEVHIEQNIDSKMFCGCGAEHFRAEPNSQVCPVCLGLPGAMPYANTLGVVNTIKFGLALGCKISEFSKFDRKHYFYPDLPKGYQISQYDLPLCFGGKMGDVEITRIHLEEDTGKLLHKRVDGKKVTLVDFNRSGVALMELVTEPDFKSVEEAISFLREIQLIARYLGISDADMEKGSMRLEANISMRKKGTKKLPNYKVELKNINSYKFLEKALKAEIQRQTAALKKGEKLVQETRGYNEDTGKTFSQREKEEAQDYRYFPEPDLPPMRFSKSEIGKIQSEIGELPRDMREKFGKLGIKDEYVELLVADRARAEYFEEAVKLGKKHKVEPLTIAGVMINQNMDSKHPEAAGLVRKLVEVTQREYSSEREVKKAVEQVLKKNKKAASDFKAGKVQVVGFLIGQVQGVLKGKGEPREIREALLSALK